MVFAIIGRSPPLLTPYGISCRSPNSPNPGRPESVNNITGRRRFLPVGRQLTESHTPRLVRQELV